jgi:hypothetical protein
MAWIRADHGIYVLQLALHFPTDIFSRTWLKKDTIILKCVIYLENYSNVGKVHNQSTGERAFQLNLPFAKWTICLVIPICARALSNESCVVRQKSAMVALYVALRNNIVNFQKNLPTFLWSNRGIRQSLANCRYFFYTFICSHSFCNIHNWDVYYISINRVDICYI